MTLLSQSALVLNIVLNSSMGSVAPHGDDRASMPARASSVSMQLAQILPGGPITPPPSTRGLQRQMAPPTPSPPARPAISNIPPPQAGWQRFGCLVVSGSDRTTIVVGAETGQFTAIQVQAFQAGVQVDKLDVILNGSQVRRGWENVVVGKDKTSEPLRFTDSAQRISSIELAVRELDGAPAVLCVNGLKS